jgi:hypothetical protein
MQRKKLLPSAPLLPAALAVAFGLFEPRAALATVSAQAGSTCVPNRSDASKLNYSRQWGIYNDNTYSAKVFCPIVWEENDFEGFVHAEITVFDQHPSSNVSCTLLGLDFDGSIGYSAGTQATSGASSSAQFLDYFDMPTFLPIYNATCTVPGTSSGKQSRIVNLGMAHID